MRRRRSLVARKQKTAAVQCRFHLNHPIIICFPVLLPRKCISFNLPSFRFLLSLIPCTCHVIFSLVCVSRCVSSELVARPCLFSCPNYSVHWPAVTVLCDVSSCLQSVVSPLLVFLQLTYFKIIEWVAPRFVFRRSRLPISARRHRFSWVSSVPPCKCQ